MVYTYRGPRSTSSLFSKLALPLLLFAGVPVILVTVTWDNIGDGAWGIGVSLIVGWLIYLSIAYDFCSEIRLSEDGWCELEAPRRVIRLHASQIRAIKTEEDGESNADHHIEFDGATMSVGHGWADFEDFVRRLQGLNPSVDLTSFRAIQ